jgi:phage FluMu protein Com
MAAETEKEEPGAPEPKRPFGVELVVVVVLEVVLYFVTSAHLSSWVVVALIVLTMVPMLLGVRWIEDKFFSWHTRPLGILWAEVQSLQSENAHLKAERDTLQNDHLPRLNVKIGRTTLRNEGHDVTVQITRLAITNQSEKHKARISFLLRVKHLEVPWLGGERGEWAEFTNLDQDAFFDGALSFRFLYYRQIYPPPPICLMIYDSVSDVTQERVLNPVLTQVHLDEHYSPVHPVISAKCPDCGTINEFSEESGKLQGRHGCRNRQCGGFFSLQQEADGSWVGIPE